MMYEDAFAGEAQAHDSVITQKAQGIYIELRDRSVVPSRYQLRC